MCGLRLEYPGACWMHTGYYVRESASHENNSWTSMLEHAAMKERLVVSGRMRSLSTRKKWPRLPWESRGKDYDISSLTFIILLDRAVCFQPLYLCLQSGYTNSTDLGACSSKPYFLNKLSRTLPVCVPRVRRWYLPKMPFWTCGLAPKSWKSQTGRQNLSEFGTWKDKHINTSRDSDAHRPWLLASLRLSSIKWTRL
jgi:hypothetical protein